MSYAMPATIADYFQCTTAVAAQPYRLYACEKRLRPTRDHLPRKLICHIINAPDLCLMFSYELFLLADLVISKRPSDTFQKYIS